MNTHEKNRALERVLDAATNDPDNDQRDELIALLWAAMPVEQADAVWFEFMGKPFEGDEV